MRISAGGRTLVAMALAMLLAVTGVAAADEADAPPYSGSDTDERCVDGNGLTGSCSIDTSADAATGAMSGAISVRSRNDGRDTGTVVALASTSINAEHQLVTTDPAVLYTVTVQVHRAVATRTGSGANTGSHGLRLLVDHSGCTERCVVSGRLSAEVVADPGGASLVDDRTYTLGALVRTEDGSPLPDGAVSLDVVGESSAILAGSGTVQVEHDATVVGVDVAFPERVPLSDPLTRHPSSTSCTQDGLGTVATCSATSELEGAMAVDSQVVSPSGGSLPGNGSAVSTASAGRIVTIPGASRAVVFVGRADVDLVRLTRDGLLWPYQSLPSADLTIDVDLTSTRRALADGQQGIAGVSLDRLEPDLQPRVQPSRLVDLGIEARAWMLAEPGTRRAEIQATHVDMVAYVFR